MTQSTGRSSERGATIFTFLLVIAGTLLAVLVVANAVSAYRVDSARRGWNDVFGTWDEVMQRFPATEANAAAIELEKLSADLGVGIAPRHTGRWKKLPQEQREAFDRLQSDDRWQYLTSQIERAQRGKSVPPPQVLSDYMAQHEEELLALRNRLNGGVPPVWESDLSLAASAPIPNLLGNLNLQKLLASVALARLHEDDAEGALEDIEAAWHLSQALDDAPILINQLIRYACARIQAGVLRQIPDVDEIWIDRLERNDFRESFIVAMKFEGWVWLYWDDSWLSSGSAPVWQRVAAPLARPYADVCLADLSDEWREQLVNLEKVDALCDRDLGPYDADLDIPLPRWNKIGQIVYPNLLGSIDRLARLELDLELTRLLIEADAERRANDGEWPADLATGQTSTACPDDEWDYTVSADGLNIALSRDVQWPDQKGTILPTRFTAN